MSSLLCFCGKSRLRIEKRNKTNPLTVADTEEKAFQSIPNDYLKDKIKYLIDEATARAEKKTSKDRLHVTSIKQDAFINVNSFLGGLLLFGLTGRRSSQVNKPDTMVLELQILSFFIFLGAIMSNLIFLLFVKFHSWKKYQPYQEALVKIRIKAASIWPSQHTNNQYRSYVNQAKHLYDASDLSDDWSDYQAYQSTCSSHSMKNQESNGHDNDEESSEFLIWSKQILDIAARKESHDRECLRRWSIFIPFSLTFIGMVILCLVVFMGAHVQLHAGSVPKNEDLQLWIYVMAPLFLVVPFVTALCLITYYTGRLHDISNS